MSVPITHRALVQRAAKWLAGTRGCCPVLTELNTRAREVPDAIGWHAGYSLLVECKVSRADFLKNRDKPHIRGERGMGRERYFLTLPGVYRPEDDLEGWGLLEYDGAKVWVRRPAVSRELADIDSEVDFLCSCLRRTHVRIRPLALSEFFAAAPGSEIAPRYRVVTFERLTLLEEIERRYLLEQEKRKESAA